LVLVAGKLDKQRSNLRARCSESKVFTP
jgi:hypothetical protein